MQFENRNDIYAAALQILKNLYGNSAEFREGQFEAIEATIRNRRTLVVQKTGWGKSLVYFTATKLHREMGRGMTLVVSPLLVLMKNQIEAATRLGLHCENLNSETREQWPEILKSAKGEKVDLIFATPEALFSESMQKALPEIRLGLFVIDEAHCISDWGHDFRLEYGKLYKIIDALPPNVSLLGTTATANDRVIADLKKQMGEDVFVSKGPLTRESLHIQVLHINSKQERYAWILENISNLPGSGIIYCLTQRDCDYLADFLKENGVSAKAYHSGLTREEASEIEMLFRNNLIKVIVATIKLGMGYDKGDISFIIHFQKPANIVSYYQQIGRAGRSLKDAYVFLMSGPEDDDIVNYFIDTAFPPKKDCEDILTIVENCGGLKANQILAKINRRKSRVDKALSFLENDGYLYKDSSRKYYTSVKQFVYDEAHYREISAIRKKEYLQMNELTRQTGCLSKYIVNCLDDHSAQDCGKCVNCIGRDILPIHLSKPYIRLAVEYINGRILKIEPRKMWAATSLTNYSRIQFINKPGICLSKYGDVGYGQLVKEGKYGRSGRFCDELVGKSAEVLRPFVQEHGIRALTFVPSVRSELVRNFAVELAESLRLEFLDSIEKFPASPQKKMENTSYQCENALKSFKIKEDINLPEKLLLVDDMVDSKWTITVCGYRLMEAGCKEVYPFALADTSGRDDL